jgi:hypothetical protein
LSWYRPESADEEGGCCLLRETQDDVILDLDVTAFVSDSWGDFVDLYDFVDPAEGSASTSAGRRGRRRVRRRRRRRRMKESGGGACREGLLLPRVVLG